MRAPVKKRGPTWFTLKEFRAVIRSEMESILADWMESPLTSKSERPPAPQLPPPGLMSTPDLARWLGVSRAKVHTMATNGKIPFVWVGAVRRFDYAQVRAALVKVVPVPKTRATRRRGDDVK